MPAILACAHSAGVEQILMPAIDVPSIHAALELCERHAGLYAMAALHPSDVKEATDADFDAVRTLCTEPKMVAIGETGLDYYWDRSFDQQQKDSLRWHIALAQERDLPLVLHLRDKPGREEAHRDVVRLLQATLPGTDPARLRGVFHCYTGPGWLAGKAAALGFVLGIGGRNYVQECGRGRTRARDSAKSTHSGNGRTIHDPGPVPRQAQ